MLRKHSLRNPHSAQISSLTYCDCVLVFSVISSRITESMGRPDVQDNGGRPLLGQHLGRFGCPKQPHPQRIDQVSACGDRSGLPTNVGLKQNLATYKGNKESAPTPPTPCHRCLIMQYHVPSGVVVLLRAVPFAYFLIPLAPSPKSSPPLPRTQTRSTPTFAPSTANTHDWTLSSSIYTGDR